MEKYDTIRLRIISTSRWNELEGIFFEGSIGVGERLEKGWLTLPAAWACDACELA
jgi:hypothetical protein